jgi:hypothetical protein
MAATATSVLVVVPALEFPCSLQWLEGLIFTMTTNMRQSHVTCRITIIIIDSRVSTLSIKMCCHVHPNNNNNNNWWPFPFHAVYNGIFRHAHVVALEPWPMIWGRWFNQIASSLLLMTMMMMAFVVL